MKKKILISVLLCVFLLSVFCFSVCALEPLQNHYIPYLNDSSIEVLFSDGHVESFVLPPTIYSSSIDDRFSYGDYIIGEEPYKLNIRVSSGVGTMPIYGEPYKMNYSWEVDGVVYSRETWVRDVIDNAPTTFPYFDVVVYPFNESQRQIYSIYFYCKKGEFVYDTRPGVSFFPVVDGINSGLEAFTKKIPLKYSYSTQVMDFEYSYQRNISDLNLIGTKRSFRNWHSSGSQFLTPIDISDYVGDLFPDSFWAFDPLQSDFCSKFSQIVVDRDTLSKRNQQMMYSYVSDYVFSASFDLDDSTTYALFHDIDHYLGLGLRLDAYNTSEGSSGFIFPEVKNYKVDVEIGLFDYLFNALDSFFSITLFYMGSVSFTVGKCMMVVFVFALGFFLIRLMR